ncbi:MAG: 6-phosphofructokinase [Chloroflexota bacterium]|nr:6-phosphofructokinase [Chloroflexota bacterium]
MAKIAVLTSGGDSPGMNACIRGVTRSATSRGAEVLGIKRGYTGIFTKNFIKLNSRAVANTIQRGGTILESSRCDEFQTVEGREKARRLLAKEGVEGVVVIGGNGSYYGAAKLAEESHIKVVGIPGTIDNDIYGTDYTVGFDTAINTALDAIDRIRDTADAFERVFFVEVMGRKSGFIALEVGIAGGAEEILLPEKGIDPESLSMTLKASFDSGKRSSIVVIAEGNEIGHTLQIAQYVQYRLDLDCRVCVLGHLQRGGSPTARDRVLGSRLGTAAVEGLFNGKSGCAVGEIGGSIVFTPLIEAATQKKGLDEHSLESMRVLSL